MERIGLIAGSGNLPLLFAKEAKKKGAKVIAFAIKDLTSPNFGEFVDKIHWIDVSKFRIQKFIILLLAERIKKMIMIGKVDKSLIFGKAKDNEDISSVLRDAKDNMDYSILEELTKRLNKIGIKVIDGLDYLRDLMPEKGVLTKRLPSKDEWEDIKFGLNLAREVARLDIGQTITVKNKAVITVEAMEGTDEAIKRAGELVGENFTVIKVARPNQDMRWDVPLVGFETLQTMIKSKARVLAIESGKMFFVEKAKVIREADLNEITIVVA